MFRSVICIESPLGGLFQFNLQEFQEVFNAGSISVKRGFSRVVISSISQMPGVHIFNYLAKRYKPLNIQIYYEDEDYQECSLTYDDNETIIAYSDFAHMVLQMTFPDM